RQLSLALGVGPAALEGGARGVGQPEGLVELAPVDGGARPTDRGGRADVVVAAGVGGEHRPFELAGPAPAVPRLAGHSRPRAARPPPPRARPAARRPPVSRSGAASRSPPPASSGR